MYFVGIDLHKKSISVCVMSGERKVVRRRTLGCAQTDTIVTFFKGLGAFEAVVEATSSYEWLWRLLEPLAARLVLAHPKKLRVIAESTRKSDKLDAQVLAEFLALDMIPQAYRPTPRQREHRALVRQRWYLRRRTTALKNKMRALLANYNADRPKLFTAEGLAYLAKLQLSGADRFAVNQLLATWHHHEQQRAALDKQLRAFAKKAPVAEKEARAVLASMPSVGPVTIDIVVSELGDVSRFRSAKRVASYAGLAPGFRESAKRARQLGISKEGSRLLRWALVETAWRAVRSTGRWRVIFENLSKRRGKKKAIVAIARRLLCVMVALMRSGQKYRLAA